MYSLRNSAPISSIGDRFIPRRLDIQQHNLLLQVVNNNHSLSSSNSNDNDESETEGSYYYVNWEKTLFFNKAKKRFFHSYYRSALREALFPQDSRVLNFFPPKPYSGEDSAKENWPVKARKRPQIEAPNVILDLPQFDANFGHQVADWSSNNLLATIFEREIHMWSPGFDRAREVTDTGGAVLNCVKWMKTQPHFAVGLRPHFIGIWDTDQKKIIFKSYCCFDICEVTSMDWINDTYLLTGCSKGALRLFTADLIVLTSVEEAHDAPIVAIAVSANQTYIATSGFDCTIKMWLYPGLHPYFTITKAPVVKAIAWHPWCNALLAIGANKRKGSVLQLWNVNLKKQVANSDCNELFKNVKIYALSFNPISAELVISLYNTNLKPHSKEPPAIIAVLVNFSKVVEEVYIHRGPVPYLLWGDEGRLLASLSADENLCVWNFFGASKSAPGRINNNSCKDLKECCQKSLDRLGNSSFSIR